MRARARARVCVCVCLSVYRCVCVCEHDNSNTNFSIHLNLENIVLYEFDIAYCEIKVNVLMKLYFSAKDHARKLKFSSYNSSAIYK